MKKRIIIALIVIAVVVLIIIVVKSLYVSYHEVTKELENERIGKDLTINISEEMEVDSSFINKVVHEKINCDGTFFGMIDDEECKKLVEYMSDNNLVIETGVYIINQTWNAEKIIETLKFREK